MYSNQNHKLTQKIKCTTANTLQKDAFKTLVLVTNPAVHLSISRRIMRYAPAFILGHVQLSNFYLQFLSPISQQQTMQAYMAIICITCMTIVVIKHMQTKLYNNLFHYELLAIYKKKIHKPNSL